MAACARGAREEGATDRAAVGLQRFARATLAFAGAHFAACTILDAVRVFVFGGLAEWGFGFEMWVWGGLTVPVSLVFGAAALAFCALFRRAEPRASVAAACAVAVAASYFVLIYAWPARPLDPWLVFSVTPAVAGLIAALVGGRFQL